MTGRPPPNHIAYLAPEGFLPELREEIGDKILNVHGRLIVASTPARAPAWVANAWLDPIQMPISSISDGAQKLRAIQRNWALYSFTSHRRAALIEGKLPSVSARPLVFGADPPKAPLGSWTLCDPNTILASASCSSPFPNGEVRFLEDRRAPPSRAYLKLWEFFTLFGKRPKPGDLCIDLGASPGGWTWVLQQSGAQVIAIDKAPLDQRIAALPNVEHRQESAFALEPDAIGQVDWLFSDIVCYPQRLLALVEKWLAAGNVRNFVCTIKFQGATDFNTASHFAAIPGSRLVHLHHNKHELTWFRIQ